MHKLLCAVCFSFTAYSLQSQAAINLEDLTKVNKDNNPQCIEYYNYGSDVYCSTKPAESKSSINPALKDYEKQHIVFDDRVRQGVWGKQTDAITTVEYIPAGDSIEQWSELVTSQYIPGLQDKITPRKFADVIIQRLEKSGFKPVVNFIEETPDHVLFEFRIESPNNMQQDELQLITKGSNGMYVLHYTIKKPDMGQQNRDKWTQLLKQSKVD